MMPIELLQTQRNREPKGNGWRVRSVEFSWADSTITSAISPSHVCHSNWPSSGAEHSHLIAGDGKPRHLQIVIVCECCSATSALGGTGIREKLAIIGPATVQLEIHKNEICLHRFHLGCLGNNFQISTNHFSVHSGVRWGGGVQTPTEPEKMFWKNDVISESSTYF